MLSRRPWSMLDQARRRCGQASQLSCPRLTDGKEGCFGTGFGTRCPSHQLPPCQRSVHPALVSTYEHVPPDNVDLEHDPEKHALGPRPDGWEPVFRKDKREAFARRSCSNKKIERDDDSKKSHPA